MAKSLRILSALDLSGAALFLDFDGTLAPIAPRPDAVVVADATRSALKRLSASLGGALAVLSGRDLADVDRLLAPLRLPVAGSHGVERRDAAGRIHLTEGGQAALEAAAAGFAPAAERHGLLLERKRGAVGLHFRGRPDLEAGVRGLADEIAASTPGLRVIHGHMVAELALADENKGRALEAFLREPPFEGRTPVAVGDDATDEDAIAAAQRLGGLGVRIGPGESVARDRAEDIGAFLAWLEDAAARLEGADRTG